MPDTKGLHMTIIYTHIQRRHASGKHRAQLVCVPPMAPAGRAQCCEKSSHCRERVGLLRCNQVPTCSLSTLF